MSITQSYERVRHVVVDNLGGGSITVLPGSGQDLVEAAIDTPDDAVEQIQIRHDHDWLRISFPHEFARHGKAELRLNVPDGLDYVIKTGSADISIGAEMARSKIVSGSGDITVGSSATDLDCSTGSGAISVARVHGNSTRLGSGSGNVSVGEVNGPLAAKSGSGDIVVTSLRRATLQANSGSGDISVSAAIGSVDLRSASGSLAVGIADNLPAWLELNSVSGEIRIGLESTAQPEPGEPYITVRARTASGDIAIYRA